MDNVIDYRQYMDNDCKIYVSVNENRLSDGRIVPLSFIWEDGNRYKIDKILNVRPAASLKAGGAGMRYTVRVGGSETHLYLEENKTGARWFMERK